MKQWLTATSSSGLGKEAKVSKITNMIVDLGPRLIMVGNETLGTADNMSIEVAEATTEEMEKLKAANEIRLVKMIGETGAKGAKND